MATVELHGLKKKYGSTEALRGIDLTIEDGEFFVILGPSGAGKTTTLKSIAGLVETDAGDVRIGGRSMDGVEPYHRNVAMAFESYALYPQKTVFDNLASPLRSGRSGKFAPAVQKERIEQVTGTLGISHLLGRFPRELSNGQRQRVALGRVLVRPADAYLLDEPLSHLDAKLRATMRTELKQLGQQSHTTSLYVTHDYQEALALGNRIAVLRDGEVVQVGTPEQIWREPADTFVAKALGQPEINLFDGGIVGHPDDQVGIRPRDLHVASDGPLRGQVRLAERLGRLVELTVRVSTVDLIVIAPSDEAAREGDDVALRFDPADLHLFNRDGKRRAG